VAGIEYFNTFGGNSVACYIAEAVLDTIIEENLQSNAQLVGEYLTSALLALSARCGSVGNIRGCGLFIGIEFLAEGDAAQRVPDPELANFIVEDMFVSARVISSRDGHVIKIKPPLVFSEHDTDTLLEALKGALIKAKRMS
jgi:4-aminobutyrate aminotransferase-like enzyme